MKKQQITILFGIFSLSLIAGCSSFQQTSALASYAETTNVVYDTNPAVSTSFANEECDPHTIVYHDDGQLEPEPDKQTLFKIYEPYGMFYDAAKDQLFYNGKLVRWFEDYYPVGDKQEGATAGTDFFCEKGIVDVYATRDLTNLPQNPDGSYDPSGILTGLKESSQEDFDSRDIEAIMNPPISEATAIEGGEVSAEDLQNMAEEYRPYGVTYDPNTGQWYFNNEKVAHLLDILTSNGESPTSGNFHGSMRTFNSDNGTLHIRTVRDFAHPNQEGNGTLTGIETYTPEK